MKKIEEHKSLREYNSFGVEATARYWYEYSDLTELRAFFAWNSTHNYPYYLLSGGNNVLFRGDYEGVVLHPVSCGVEVIERSEDRVLVRVAAGELWDDFVAWAVERGYGGVENLSLIPSYVGAAPVQNIGAYGVELKDHFVEAEVYLIEEDRVVVMDRPSCAFGYRESVFKGALRGRAIIFSVTFSLSLNPELSLSYGALRECVESLGEPTIATVREAVLSIREAKLPDPQVLGNAGSFFKNPVVSAAVAEQLLATYPQMPTYEQPSGEVKLAAGWLIDQAGWRGRSLGRAGVHDKQALVLVNLGGATGADVLSLAEAICADVRARFGVQLQMEVNVL